MSVVVATCNYAQFLPEAIGSVLEQTFEDWELIIIDDGSTDGTREMVARFLSDRRIIYVFQNKRGVSVARNKGIRLARGKYISFLDADDLYFRNKLKKQVEFLEQNPKCGLTYSDVRYFIHPRRERLIVCHWRNYEGHESIKIMRKNFIPLPTAMIRRDVLGRSGLFDEARSYGEEWELWIRMVLAGIRFHYLDEVLCLVRVHGGNSLLDHDAVYAAERRLVKEVGEKIKLADNPSLLDEWKIMKCFVDYKFAGGNIMVGRERRYLRRILTGTLPTMARLDRRRFIRGVACLAYSFLPRRLRAKLSSRMAVLVSPYYAFS